MIGADFPLIRFGQHALDCMEASGIKPNLDTMDGLIAVFPEDSR